MGRRVRQFATIHTRVRAARLARGLSQVRLAAETGLARQAIGAIESGAYVPNTLVALALARALGSTVEALFTLAEDDQQHRVQLVDDAAPDERRLAVARVRDRWIGHPLRPEREIDQGLVAASGVLPGTTSLAAGHDALAALLVPREVAERTALLLGCDPSLGLVDAHLSVSHPAVRVVWLSAASEPALAAIRDGRAHVAGSHLHDPACTTCRTRGVR
jgi:DNA-binding XRE family transcriptional regulator